MHCKKLSRGALCASLLAICVCGGVASAASDAYASRPRTLNGTQIDDDGDAEDAGDTYGRDYSSPVVLPQSGPRVNPPVVPQEPSWWERFMRWVCA
jgi:hypothetical protein